MGVRFAHPVPFDLELNEQAVVGIAITGIWNMTLKCECCGFEKEFADGEEAFQAGWDCPPHFTGYVCCDLCPGSFVVLGCTHTHAAAHEKWAKEGRPAEFQIP